MEYSRPRTQPKMYEAYGRIEKGSLGLVERIPGGRVPEGYAGDNNSKLLTEIEILKSDSLMLKVCREMDLSNNPDFLEKKGPVPHTTLDDGETRQTTVHRMQSNQHVALVQKTDIIRISYSSLNPKLSADIVNQVISDYIQRSYQTRFESTQRVSEFLSSTLEGLKQQVETSQEQVLDMQRRLGILAFDPTHNQDPALQLDDLAKASGAAKPGSNYWPRGALSGPERNGS